MLRFYYVNVYRTICFFMPQLSPLGDDDELLMDFFVFAVSFFTSFLLLPDESALRLSRFQNASIEFTMFNGVVWAMR